MTRKLAILLAAVAIFMAGHYLGRQGERDRAVWAVTVANAKADAYALAAIATAGACQAEVRPFKQ